MGKNSTSKCFLFGEKSSTFLPNLYQEIDSMNIFQSFGSQMPRKNNRIIRNQSDVYKHIFNEEAANAHCAFFDVWMLSKILVYLVQENISYLFRLFQNGGKEKEIKHCLCKSGCTGRRCGCVKENRLCTKDCKCHEKGCSNLKKASQIKHKEQDNQEQHDNLESDLEENKLAGERTEIQVMTLFESRVY